MTKPSRQAPTSRLHRWFGFLASASVLCAIAIGSIWVGILLLLQGPTVYGSAGGALAASELERSPTRSPAPAEMTVMTLNLAHGRAEKSHQALLSKETITKNLDQVAALLRGAEPDVVALQEADGPSLWSGRFDHVAHLAEKSGLEHHFRGNHVQGLKVAYGTALLSDHPLGDTASITFPPSPPTLTKGVVFGAVQMPGVGPVTVASVHLDFSRKSVRQEQIDRLVEALADRPRPMIVLGDFNCDWDDESTLPDLAEQLGLHAVAPDDETITFPKLRKRLDWILVSDNLELVDYQVSPQPLSDHRAVIARVRVAGDRP